MTALKEMTNTHKLTLLRSWLPEIVTQIKKDLKNDHLTADKAFLRKYFPNERRHKLEAADLVPAYSRELFEVGNEGLAEFICYRWLLRHRDLYDYFAKRLETITGDFDKINQLDDSQAGPWVKEAISLFGAPDTYVFVVLNSVVVSDGLLKDLANQAEQARGKTHPHAQ